MLITDKTFNYLKQKNAKKWKINKTFNLQNSNFHICKMGEIQFMVKKTADEINLTQVKIDDGFWNNIQKLVIDEVIPYQEKILNDEIEGVEKSHALENFRIAAGIERGTFYGMVFQDSDVAKWLEGVAYSLAVKPDDELETRADEIIDIIEKAQQPDGYLNTYFSITGIEKRWTNLHEGHEMYCAGHMMEAAVAYYEVTGKKKLLSVMQRMADHMISWFVDGKHEGIPGHQEIETGLMKLYHATGDESYRNLAKHFLDERGKNPCFFEKETEKRGWRIFPELDPKNTLYNQSYAPVREQKEAVGHSVRAVYMYRAMADVASAANDESLLEACRRLWDNITQKKMYLTGGIGSTSEGESFSINYELPNDLAYAETCAAIGLVFFAKSMLDIEMDGRYADVMELAMYNGTISGMQADGRKFLYVNPLEVEPGVSGKVLGYKSVSPERWEWHACACCPPNLVRMVTSIGKYAWSENETAIYSHLFMGQEATFRLADVKVDSKYPWEGHVAYHVHARTEESFTLAIHIPAYIHEMCVTVNGTVIDAMDIRKGYLYLTRKWGEDDCVDLEFPMKARKIYANQNVREDAGKVAIMRGPIVYCFEGMDQVAKLQQLRIPRNADIQEIKSNEKLFDNVRILKFHGIKIKTSDDLYSEEVPEEETCELLAIPYYLWGNRGVNQMRVWLEEQR